MNRCYAQGTSVPADRTRSEIEQFLTRRGATATMIGNTAEKAMLVFELEGRRIRFLMPLPVRKRGDSDSRVAAELRRRWRALLLVLKAKLEAVASHITTLDEEFLAHIIVQGNETVGDRIIPELHGVIADKGHKLPPLLGPGSAV